MAESLNQLISTALARVRDPQGAMHSRTLVLDLFSRLQPLYSNQLQLIQSSQTLFTAPFLQVYLMDQLNPRLLTITSVLHDNRELDPLTLSQLQAIDRAWPRAVGPRYEGYIQLGYSHLLLWPARMDPSVVTVTGTILTPTLTSDPLDTLTISDQQAPGLLALVELLLLQRARDFPSFQAHQSLKGFSSGTQTQTPPPAVES